MRKGSLKVATLGVAVALSVPVLAQTGVTPVLQMNPSSGMSPSSASELLNMLEQNRQEITELRGLVEQLTFEVEQLKKQSKERYIDLDRRLLEMSQGGGTTTRNGAVGSGGSSAVSTTSAPLSSVGPAVTATTVAPVAVAGSGAPAAVAAGTQAPTADAQAAYDAAYQFIKDREYEKAVDAFHAFINQYPESDLTPNAYYWLGEVYLVIPKPELAKQAFIVVVSKYTTHRKAPDAFYKLGVTYDRLGSKKEAETFLQQTISRFPNTTSAKLAQDYLKKMKTP